MPLARAFLTLYFPSAIGGKEGATCSMLYFQFLFLCISVPIADALFNNLRSMFALATQPIPSPLPLSVTVITNAIQGPKKMVC